MRRKTGLTSDQDVLTYLWLVVQDAAASDLEHSQRHGAGSRAGIPKEVLPLFR